ncbi:MAG TPA: hypothetical protein VF260_06160 [Bacilli bacterium]
MLIALPERWDGNEWFVTIATLLVLFIWKLLPRRMNKSQMWFIVFLNVLLGLFTDSLFGGGLHNFYDMNDSPKGEITDYLLYMATFPLTILIILHFYGKWRPTGLWRLIFILIAAGITAVLEFVSVKFAVFQYIRWNLLYSFCVYTVVHGINVLMFDWTRRFPRNRVSP